VRPRHTVRPGYPPLPWPQKGVRVTEDERNELSAAHRDLLDEEADQQEQRGYASARILRAIARLERLLDGAPDRPDEAMPPAPDQT
jgi:hypothetical protein